MAVQDYKINYKSDFVLNINGDAGWAVPFCIKFWTGMPSQAYFVGFDGVKYVNCRVGDTPTQLLVMFDDHHLPIGKLMMQIAYHTTIEEFPGSVFDEVTNARDVIVTIDGTDYQVLLDFTGEDAPELEFDLPAYANEAERIQNELQRQQNEADRIAAELQREQATSAAVQGAENVNAQLNGTTLTVTNRNGVSTSVNTKGERGEQGPVGPEGPQGEQGETGISIVSFTPKIETSTTLIYTVTFSDGTTQDVPIPKGAKGDTGATGPQGQKGDTGVSITAFTYASETETDMIYTVTFSDSTTQQVSIPKGAKGDTGEQGPVGPQGPQGPMGDVAVITPEQQAAFTMYRTTGQNTDGPMTQKAVTDNLVASSISYDNSQSGLSSNNVQGAVDELSEDSDVYAECLADCIQGEGVKNYVTITSSDLARQNASFGSATTRINLKKTSLISTEGYFQAQLGIPISAVSGGVDRATIGLYDSSKTNLSSLDLGWFYFNGNDLLITLDLSNPIYAQVAYISCYFGCASGSITLSNVDATKITFIMTASTGQIEKAVTESGMRQYLNDYEVLSNCNHIGGNTVVKQISNYDLLNGNAAFAAAAKRLILGKDSLMDVRGGSSITLFVPYSAVSSAGLITQCTMGLYDIDKNWLQSLDLGWQAFNGSDKTITVDLSDPTYKEVAYVSCYFYSASNIDQNSIDASGITFTLTYPDEYHTKAVDTRMFETLAENADARTMVSYYGQKMGCVHKFDSKEIMYMPSYSEARQGADIYGNYLFQCFNKNPYIQIWDLSTRTLTQTIQFTPDSNNHCGSVSFGDFYDSADPFPLLYISAFNVNYVYVYRISGEIGNLSMTLIQTITIDSTWMRMPYVAIDRINKKMLVYGYTKNSYQDPNNNPMKFGYMNILDPTNATVTLTSSDMIKTYEMPYVFAGQSSAARYGNLYLMWGYAGNAQGSGIKMYDYINGIILAECDTNELLNHTDEWQGAGWWNDNLVTTSKDGIVRLLEF